MPSDVLNLPVFASLQEIKERHRSLSLIFHPDKHHDPKVRDAAVKKFLEIQKAYEGSLNVFLEETGSNVR